MKFDAMTFAIYAIMIPPDDGSDRWYVSFGKGRNDEAAVRARLRPEHGEPEIFMRGGIESFTELNMRFLFLLDGLNAEHGPAEGVWRRMSRGHAGLYVTAAFKQSASTPAFPVSAETMSRWRSALEVDQGVIAAMLGCATTRVHRLEHGKSKLTFDDYRSLRYWAVRLGRIDEFELLFPIDPVLSSDVVPSSASAVTQEEMVC